LGAQVIWEMTEQPNAGSLTRFSSWMRWRETSLNGCFRGMGPRGQHIGFPGPPDGSPATVVGGGMKI
jgi:hypothetical protein